MAAASPSLAPQSRVATANPTIAPRVTEANVRSWYRFRISILRCPSLIEGRCSTVESQCLADFVIDQGHGQEFAFVTGNSSVMRSIFLASVACMEKTSRRHYLGDIHAGSVQPFDVFGAVELL